MIFPPGLSPSYGDFAAANSGDLAKSFFFLAHQNFAFSGVVGLADDTFQLHAFEKGAGYGQPGDVWSGAPVSPDGGYLVSLGDPGLDIPMLAEVYTFPTDIPADLTIEATVTETTCGRELLGEVLQAQAGKVTVNELTLAMPDCDALGDILVLKNPGRDTTLATVN